MLTGEPLAQVSPRKRLPAVGDLERLDLLADPVEPKLRAEIEVDARELARIEPALLGEPHDLENLRRERERRDPPRDRLRKTGPLELRDVIREPAAGFADRDLRQRLRDTRHGGLEPRDRGLDVEPVGLTPQQPVDGAAQHPAGPEHRAESG